MDRTHEPSSIWRAELGREGFEGDSDTYERARPSYPPAVIAHLAATTGITGGSRVLDVAAGTGKLTRPLDARGAVCVAIEPSASMREVFARVVPGVSVLGGTAERLPLAPSTVDAVVVGQAFHWFDPDAALAEMARVLAPGGWLAVVWNERDDSNPMVSDLIRISEWDTHTPYAVGRDYGQVIGTCRRFGPVERTKVSFVQELDRSAFVDQVASRSYVQVMPKPERQALLDRVAKFASTLAEPIGMPYVSDLFCAQLQG